jgi:3-deoxy-D-manno-octulosonic acid (KDO) 8-phosphate synthase
MLKLAVTGRWFLLPDHASSKMKRLRFDVQAVADYMQRHFRSLIFKASYDKANRTSVSSFRGPGLKEGIRILPRFRSLGLPLTDVHSVEEVQPVSAAVDVLQIPAFLCRQTTWSWKRQGAAGWLI